MNINDPIRMSDVNAAHATASSVSRAEAERQFKVSFALVIILTLGTLVAVATLPMNGWENGYGFTQQVASQTATVR